MVLNELEIRSYYAPSKGGIMKAVIAFSAVAFFLSTSAHAQSYSDLAGGWSVVGGDKSCGMMMEFEGPGSTELIVMEMLEGDVILSIRNGNWSAQEGEVYDLSVSLNGQWYTGKARGLERRSSGGLMMKLVRSFLDDFAQGTSLHVYLGEDRIDQLSLDGTAVARASMDKCLRQMRSEVAAAEREKQRFADLPKDPFAPERIANGAPTPLGIEEWAVHIYSNYPSRALRDGVQGRVQVTVGVDANGRVSSCRATSNGLDVLEEAACDGYRRYARFNPATDANGNPTAGSYTNAVNFVLP